MVRTTFLTFDPGPDQVFVCVPGPLLENVTKLECKNPGPDHFVIWSGPFSGSGGWFMIIFSKVQEEEFFKIFGDKYGSQ